MMKRRWSNNGGFAQRMLEESSSEVTSSSAGLVMTASGLGGLNGGGGGGGGGGVGVMGSNGLNLSPTSLGSQEYSELEMWYEEAAYAAHGTITSAVANGMGLMGLVGSVGAAAIGNSLAANGIGVINGGGGMGGGGGGCTTTSQTTIIPLPSMQLAAAMNHAPRSSSANSISSGNLLFTGSFYKKYFVYIDFFLVLYTYVKK